MSKKATPYQVAKWLPSDQKVVEKWLDNLIEKVKADGFDVTKINDGLLADLHSPVEALKNAIQDDPELNMFFYQMFWQQENPKGKKVFCWQIMIRLLNKIMTTAPEYNDTGLVGFPINAILNWSMATPAGYAAFLNDKVNLLFKNILNYWGKFLMSPDSCYVLNDDPQHGWFGTNAMEEMPGFAKDFVCDPHAQYYGFTSWDDFFTRVFRPGVRPVASPDDDSVIANACESAPYKISCDINKHDAFWIKSQRYSLYFMLGRDELAQQFYGGVIYQAFLSATSYHRWHSPVNGTIKKIALIDGSYYSATHNIQDDPESPNASQGYITHVAARGIIYIEADNPDIGLMCFVSIGMAEVSSNDITVYEGKMVKKGDEIGMFHFGGSTHCLVFRPGVNVEFDLGGQTPGLHSTNIPVRSRIATVKSA